MEISVNLEELIHKYAERAALTTADIAQIAANQAKRIQTRTKSGVDVNGTPFVGYASGTEKSGPVDLGSLSDAVLSEAHSPEEGRVFISPDKAEIASYHNRGTRRLPRRQFMGVSDQDKSQIQEEVREMVTKRMRS